MTACRQEMIDAGESLIPKSCPTCKLGPCQRKQTKKEVSVCYLVANENTDKRVVVLDQRQAEQLADLMDCEYDTIPLLSGL